jgi:ribosomal protein L16 Arg81 hydroxylase
MPAEHLGIEDTLSPVSTAGFLRDYYGRAILHLEGESSRWEPVFGWPDLNALLSSNRLSSPQLRLVRGGAAIDESLYYDRYQGLDAGRLGEALRSGATLVLHSVDELAPRVAELASSVQHLFRAPVTVNLYATWGEVEGYKVHWDDHDVFALQLAGSKLWQVFEPTWPWPSEADAHLAQPPDSPPVADLLLTAGDLLYIPHGWWHVANTRHSPSMHLTIGVRPRSGVDLLYHLIDLLRQHELVRRRLPKFDTDGSADEYVATLASLVDTALTVEALQDCIRSSDRMQPARLALSLPYAAEERPGLSVAADAPLTFLAATAVIEALPDRVVLQAGAHRLSFKPPTVAPLLGYLVDASRFTIETLVRMSGLTEEQVRALIGELLKAGLVRVY